MSEKECRFCLDSYETISNKLISPCLCRGTQKYVHQECLNQWRFLNKETIHYTTCNECRINYVMGTKYPMEKCIMNTTWKYIMMKLSLYYSMLGIFYGAIENNNFEESFSHASFFSSITSIGFLFLYVLTQLSRKKKYFQFATLPYLTTLIFIFHYQYNVFFIEVDKSRTQFSFLLSLTNSRLYQIEI